jgi:hypothetical protein
MTGKRGLMTTENNGQINNNIMLLSAILFLVQTIRVSSQSAHGYILLLLQATNINACCFLSLLTHIALHSFPFVFFIVDRLPFRGIQSLHSQQAAACFLHRPVCPSYQHSCSF